MRYFSFTRWLKVKEGFNSLTHYNEWLHIVSVKFTKEESIKTDLYYHEKYIYWQKYLQTERD